LKTLEIKVSVVAPNTSIKLVIVLPVTVMMKASSKEALCPLVEIVRDTGRLR
jgi:hypothetical protein